MTNVVFVEFVVGGGGGGGGGWCKPNLVNSIDLGWS